MMSSLRSKNLQIDKFDDFSSDIDLNSKTYIFRDAISLIINQCEPSCPKGAFGEYKVSVNRAVQTSEKVIMKS